MNWITSLRPFTVIKVGILTLLSFKISTGVISPIALHLASFVTFGAAATMVLNDWFDREHDLKKGKNFAFNQGRKFLLFTAILWVSALAMIVWIWFNYTSYAALSWLLLALGFFYFLTRHIVGLSAIVVSLAGSLPTLFAYIAQPSKEILALFVVVFLLMLGRETIKDLQGLHDEGYKKTIPVTFGVKVSKTFVTIVFLMIVPLVGFISLWLPFLVTIGIGFAVYYLNNKDDKRLAKRAIDLTSILVLGFLFV